MVSCISYQQIYHPNPYLTSSYISCNFTSDTYKNLMLYSLSDFIFIFYLLKLHVVLHLTQIYISLHCKSYIILNFTPFYILHNLTPYTILNFIPTNVLHLLKCHTNLHTLFYVSHQLMSYTISFLTSVNVP